MDCNQPLSDDQITAALDNELDELAQEHLNGCPACQARLESARRFESRLKQRLYRFECLPPNLLRDYAMDLLDSGQVSRVDAHLGNCPLCRNEVADLRAFLEVDELEIAESPAQPESSLLDIFKRFGDLIPRPASARPASVLRGVGREPMQFEAEDLTLFIEIEKQQNGYAVMGQIIAIEQDKWIGALIECRQENQVVATSFVSEAGIFSCELPDLQSTSLRIIPETGRPVFIENIQPDA